MVGIQDLELVIIIQYKGFMLLIQDLEFMIMIQYLES